MTTHTDPRIRHAFIATALAALDDVARTRKGTILFLAGESGSGRSATLGALAAQARTLPTRPLVLHASFDPHAVPAAPPDPTLRQKIVDLFGADIFITLAGTIHPLAGIVAQLLSAVGPLRDVAQAWGNAGRPSLEVPWLFGEALQRVAATRPILCLLDDLEAAGAPWIPFFREEAALVATKPLLLILAVEGAATLPAEPPPGERDALSLARTLQHYGQARYQYLPPLTVAEVAEWIQPADPKLVGTLHTLTRGNPTWLQALWTQWQAKGVVQLRGWRGKRWELLPTFDDEGLHPIQRILGDFLAHLELNRQEAERARLLLNVAALEGPTFTADALALAVGQERDEVLDFLDDFLAATEEEPDNLLLPLPALTLLDGAGQWRDLWRYTFADPLLWRTLATYGLGQHVERPRYTAALAKALDRLYSLDPTPVAPTLVRLYTVLGNAERATHFQRAADRAHTTETVRWQTHFLLQADTLATPTPTTCAPPPTCWKRATTSSSATPPPPSAPSTPPTPTPPTPTTPIPSQGARTRGAPCSASARRTTISAAMPLASPRP